MLDVISPFSLKAKLNDIGSSIVVSGVVAIISALYKGSPAFTVSAHCTFTLPVPPGAAAVPQYVYRYWHKRAMEISNYIQLVVHPNDHLWLLDQLVE